jgi:hypothetical protein
MSQPSRPIETRTGRDPTLAGAPRARRERARPTGQLPRRPRHYRPLHLPAPRSSRRRCRSTARRSAERAKPPAKERCLSQCGQVLCVATWRPPRGERRPAWPDPFSERSPEPPARLAGRPMAVAAVGGTTIGWPVDTPRPTPHTASRTRGRRGRGAGLLAAGPDPAEARLERCRPGTANGPSSHRAVLAGRSSTEPCDRTGSRRSVSPPRQANHGALL